MTAGRTRWSHGRNCVGIEPLLTSLSYARRSRACSNLAAAK